MVAGLVQSGPLLVRRCTIPAVCPACHRGLRLSDAINVAHAIDNGLPQKSPPKRANVGNRRKGDRYCETLAMT